MNSEKKIIDFILKSRISYFDEIKPYLIDYSKIEETENYERIEKIKVIMEKLWVDMYKKPFIKKIQETISEFELILSMLGNRDHFSHQFKVYLIGIYIIINVSEHLYIKNKDDLFSGERFLFTWLLCSTFHDVGYPIEMFQSLNIKLYEFYSILEIKNASQKYYKLSQKRLGSLMNQKVRKDKNRINIYSEIGKYLKKMNFIKKSVSFPTNYIKFVNKEKIEVIDHGFASSVILMKKIYEHFIKMGDFDLNNDSLKKNINNALEASSVILFHNENKKHIEKLNINDYPLHWLMIFTDEIQEWNRDKINSSYKYYHRFYEIKSYDSRKSKSIIIKLIVELNKENPDECWLSATNMWKRKIRDLRKLLVPGSGKKEINLTVIIFNKGYKKRNKYKFRLLKKSANADIQFRKKRFKKIQLI